MFSWDSYITSQDCNATNRDILSENPPIQSRFLITWFASITIFGISSLLAILLASQNHNSIETFTTQLARCELKFIKDSTNSADRAAENQSNNQCMSEAAKALISLSSREVHSLLNFASYCTNR